MRFALLIRGITDALPMSLVLPKANREILVCMQPRASGVRFPSHAPDGAEKLDTLCRIEKIFYSGIHVLRMHLFPNASYLAMIR